MKTAKKTLVSKILALKPSEAIELMIKVNLNPLTVLDQSTFGEVIEGSCYGCSACNALLSLSGLKETEPILEAVWQRYLASYNGRDEARFKGFYNKADKNGYEVIGLFEAAINFLRMGELHEFLLIYPYLEKNKIQIETIHSRERKVTNVIEKQEEKWVIVNPILPQITNDSVINSKVIKKFRIIKSLFKKANL